MKIILFAFVLQFSLILPAIAQDNYAEEILRKQSQRATKTNVIKLDLGLGLGGAGSGAGLSGRMAVGFNTQNWGGTYRMMFAYGHTGKHVNNIFFGGYYLRERFYEKAILLDHIVKRYNNSQLKVGAGIASVRGNRLNDEGSHEIDFEKIYGCAFEATWETTGKIFGGSAQIYGNINKEAIFIGVVFGLTVGGWWD